MRASFLRLHVCDVIPFPDATHACLSEAHWPQWLVRNSLLRMTEGVLTKNLDAMFVAISLRFIARDFRVIFKARAISRFLNQFSDFISLPLKWVLKTNYNQYIKN